MAESPTPPSWLTPAVVSERALRLPPPDLARLEAARVNAGLTPAGLEYPRGRFWAPAILPGAIADVGLIAAAGATTSLGLGIVAAAVTAALGAGVGFIRADPLRINRRQHRRLNQDRAWQSPHAWVGGLTQTPERRLLGQAQAAVTTIANSPAWRDERHFEERVRLDLIAELQQIDDQAYRLATLDPAAPADPIDPAAEQARAALAARVDALTTYATSIADVAVGPAPLPPPDPATEHELQAGAVRDDYARNRLEASRARLDGSVPPDADHQ
jgi:hypothetical protein